MTPPPLTILIIDDEPDFTVLLRPRLERAGYQVQAAYDGPEGLTAVRACAPALIVLDISMPSMSGFVVCQQLKAAPETAAIPVILLTAKAQEHERQTGLACGAAAYFTKPFDTPALLAAIQRLLTGTHSED
ncbi:MAG: response regulator [Deltaproteobacteria bacterium]|nr:response regulator [Deltaproteobacteria bacterium]